jgi:hypothetical protein
VLFTQFTSVEVLYALEVSEVPKTEEVETNTSYVVGTELVALLQLRVTVVG